MDTPEKIRELRKIIDNGIHRNDSDLYWQAMSKILEIIEDQQRQIQAIWT